MESSGKNYEIVVVDDGSCDRTAAIAAELPCRLLRQSENRGYGAALKRGIAAARSELCVIIDADGTYPAADIPRLLAAAADHDMVVGARTGPQVRVPWTRRPAKWFLRQLASYQAERPIPDLNSGFRVLRRSQVQRFAHILPAGFSFTTTITLALLCNDYRVGYVPIDYGARVGRSKIVPADAYRFLLLILRAIVLFNPLRVFLPLGFLLFLAGVAKIVEDLIIGNLSESAVMAVLGAILVWCFGLLADQNARLSLPRDEAR
jgi:glycosyltransferase involved in cell wall biosynthesis